MEMKGCKTTETKNLFIVSNKKYQIDNQCLMLSRSVLWPEYPDRGELGLGCGRSRYP
jgi:hypothetical protein